MKLSISNIAWERNEDYTVASLLQNSIFTGIEVAPTKINNLITSITEEELIKYRLFWNDKGLDLVAMQSLLFGRPELKLFGNKEDKDLFIGYFSNIFRIAKTLGTKKLVFGSPKNRLVDNIDRDIAFGIAVDMFHELGSLAFENGLVLCIEPNPSDYGCDFITSSIDGLKLVQQVNHPGFRLHLDTGGIILNKENLEATFEQCIPYTQHFHISEPFLGMIGAHWDVHKQVSKLLKSFDYNNWVSIEMKNNVLSDNVLAVQQAVEIVSEIYRN